MRWPWATWLLVFAGVAFAQEPRGEPVTGSVLKDTEFGVGTRGVGLHRRVEMYQWRRAEGGYRKDWSERPVDSSGFDAAHRNPGAFPMQSRYWVAADVSLDGKPVHEDVLKQLGAWHDFRPGFTALPGNLSATFQPEGDGLSSTENPLDPQVGDLRITWREMRLPQLQGRVALEQGRWVPGKAEGEFANVEGGAAASSRGAASDARGRGMPGTYIAIAAGFAALLFVLSFRRRRRR